MKLKRALAALLAAAMLSGGVVTAVAEESEAVEAYVEAQEQPQAEPEPEPQPRESQDEPAGEEKPAQPAETAEGGEVVAVPEEPVVSEEPVHNLGEDGTDDSGTVDESAPESGEGEAAPAPETPAEGEEVSQTPEQAVTEIRVSAANSAVKVGEQAAFRIAVTNASAVKFRLVAPDDAVIAAGDGQNGEGQYTFTPDMAGRYTMTVSGVDVNGETVSASASLDVSALAELNLSVGAPAVCYGGDPVEFSITLSGSTELAYCLITARQSGEEFWRSEAFAPTITLVPSVQRGVTDVTLSVEVTDIYGRKASGSATVPCAVHDEETRADWEATMADVQLTGVWPQDLLAIAWSQVGYVESAVNFGEKYSGGMSGYTRYGDWAGLPYEEWCAMFCSFCLHYAGIPKEAFDRASNCQRWIRALTAQDLYAPRAEYTPKLGDLVFFDWQNNNDSDHVGIVYDIETDAQGTPVAIWTIEGNSSGGAVTCDDRYAINDSSIVGYGLVNRAYDRLIEARPGELSAEYEGYSVSASFQPEADIPARAFLSVREIAQGGQEFDDLAAALSGALLEAGDGAVSAARFLDIGIVDEWGEAVEVSAPVRVNVSFKENLGADSGMKPGVACVGAGVTVDRAVEYTSDAWSTAFRYETQRFDAPTAFFLSGQLKGRKGSMAASDGDVDVKLAYGAKAGLPKGVEVSLRVIRSGDSDYEALMDQLRYDASIPNGAFVRLCEISLTYNGIAMAPSRDINVEINCLKDAADARVVRLSDDAAMKARFYRRKSHRTAARFTTSRLGVFAVVYTPVE